MGDVLLKTIEEAWSGRELPECLAASDKLFKRLYCSPAKWSIPTETRVWRLGPLALHSADRSQKSKALRTIEAGWELQHEDLGEATQNE